MIQCISFLIPCSTFSLGLVRLWAGCSIGEAVDGIREGVDTQQLAEDGGTAKAKMWTIISNDSGGSNHVKKCVLCPKYNKNQGG